MKKFICILLVILTLSVMPAYAFDPDKATELYNNEPEKNSAYNAYSVVNCRELRILEQKNGDEKQPVGSLVKIMTIYLTYDALEHFTVEKNTEIKVPKKAMSIEGNRAFLDAYKGEVVTVEQALQAVCINSSQDAAYCLATAIGKDEAGFVQMMNDKAKELGLNNTYFTDCTGVDKVNQYSTANDMATLIYHLLIKYPQVTDLTSVKSLWFKHSTGVKDTMLTTNNSFLRFSGRAKGLSATSSEETGYCLAATSESSGDRIICVVLGAADDNTGLALAKRLTEKSIKDYKFTALDVAGTYVRRIAVTNGKEKTVKGETAKDFSVFIKTEQLDKVKKTVEPLENVKAPLKKGDVIGHVVYTVDDVELGRMEVVAAEDVKKAGFFTRMIRWILSIFGIK